MPLLSSPHEDVRSHVLVILSEVVRVVGQATATATTASSVSGHSSSISGSGTSISGSNASGDGGGSGGASGTSNVMSTVGPVEAVGGGSSGDRSQLVTIVHNMVLLLVKFVKIESVVELVMAGLHALIMVSCMYHVYE